MTYYHGTWTILQRSPKRFHIISRRSLKTLGKYRTVNSLHCLWHTRVRVTAKRARFTRARFITWFARDSAYLAWCIIHVQCTLRTSNNYITWTIESNVHPRNPLNPLSQQNSFSNFLLALRMDTLIGYKRRQETHRQPSYPQRSLPLVGYRSRQNA